MKSAYAQQIQPEFQTDFENVVKTDTHHISIPIRNWFEFGDEGAGASMWIDSTIAHGGTKSLGLQVTDISKSRRAEFNIFPYSLVGDELTVSSWLYLPVNYGLHSPNLNWHEFNVLYQEYQSGMSDQYLRLLIEQPDISKSVFNLTLGGRLPPNSTQYEVGRVNNYALPRGRWFNVYTYLKRDRINGKAEVWIDGKLIFNVSNLNTKGSVSDYYITPAKVYYDTGDTTVHQMWVDDVQIYPGFVPTQTNVSNTPQPSSSPALFSGDANNDKKIDGVDYIIWLNHYNQNTSGANNGDFNNDGKVDGVDYVIWLNSY